MLFSLPFLFYFSAIKEKIRVPTVIVHDRAILSPVKCLEFVSQQSIKYFDYMHQLYSAT